jgi:uncharacterized phage infection (PIP) family protein YhgE
MESFAHQNARESEHISQAVQSAIAQVSQTFVAGFQQEVREISKVLHELALKVGEQTVEIRQLRQAQTETADQGERITAIETRRKVMEEQADRYNKHFQWLLGTVLAILFFFLPLILPHLRWK